MPVSRPALLFISILLLSPGLAAQQVPASDPRAVYLAGRAWLMLTGGNPISDVTLTGTAQRIAGSLNETGTATLKALGTDHGRIDWALPSGQRAEARNVSAGLPAGAWVGPDSLVHQSAQHNCWTDAVWFFPALSSLAQSANPNFVFSYVGQEAHAGVSVQHIRSYRYLASRKASSTADVQRLSVMDFLLDSSTLLPVAISFRSHPDRDQVAEIAIEISFSDYHLVNGLRVPFRIRKYLNGGLVLDLSLSSIVLNSGLSASNFVLP